MMSGTFLLYKANSVKNWIGDHFLVVPLFFIILGASYYVHILHEQLDDEISRGTHHIQPMFFLDPKVLDIKPMFVRDEPRSAVDISWPRLALTAAPLVFVLMVSKVMKLNLEKALIIGMMRTTIQLSVLGFILDPIFQITEWYFILGFSLLQTLLAAREVVAVAKWHYNQWLMYIQNVFCIGIPCFSVVLFAQTFTLDTDPFYLPQYWIPFSGMIIGNASRANSLLTVSILKDLSEKQNEVEWVLSRGGTKWDAAIYYVRNSISVALYPNYNSMVIAGLITIPGTMVGNILGGTDPFLAAKYQVLVYILIYVSSAFASLLMVVLTVLAVFDKNDRLMVDRIKVKKKGSKDWVSALFYLIFRILKFLLTPIFKCLYRCFGCDRCCRCCPCCPKEKDAEKVSLLG